MIAAFYLWIKALHVIAVIAWMAGLLYLPRLFVRHATHAPVGSEMSEVFKIMEDKLYRLIMRPARFFSFSCGILMAVSGMIDYTSPWFIIKMIAVFFMAWFHEYCGARLRDFAADRNTRTPRHYRIANEVPTVLMIIIVIMVVVKPF